MKIILLPIVVFTILLGSSHLFAYGVLSHEELIDISWDSDIKPTLLKRFPTATEDELKEAHAYAYGASNIYRPDVPAGAASASIDASSPGQLLNALAFAYGGSGRTAALSGAATANVRSQVSIRCCAMANIFRSR